MRNVSHLWAWDMPSFVRRESNFVISFDVADPADNGRFVMLHVIQYFCCQGPCL